MISSSEADRDYSNSYFVLDFDRCLASVEKFHSMFEEIVAQATSITAAQLGAAKRLSENNGTSFDTVDYIRRMLETGESYSARKWEDIVTTFILQSQARDMLEPYAADLLTILDDWKIPYGIITYGSEVWQLAKIQAANLFDVPHVVTRILEKGVLLNGWRYKGGEGFIIPPAMTRDFKALKVQEIVFLDDKVASFQKIPKGVKGIRVRPFTPRKGILLENEKLPSGVVSVDGLNGAIEFLFGLK